MVEKLKDAANKLKAKIGGDDLDEKLVEATSEENWQASTQLLHQISNAAYNYEKWSKISQFIWDKLKKSKSWRKILKTLNMVEFLLKNGPPSIISNFKYDIYQFRTFDSYSHYSDGADKGEPSNFISMAVRQRAKAIVELLSNQELLEEERVKAKTIRERMSGVVGGAGMNYGAYSGSSYGSSSYGGNGGNGSYGGYDSKKYTKDSSSSYGTTGMGMYGDYNYNKSTLDKYKDNQTTSTTKPTGLSKPATQAVQPPPQQVAQEVKKPFQQEAKKLVKPGEKKDVPISTNVQPKANESVGLMDDLLDVKPTPVTQPTVTKTQPAVQTQPANSGDFFDFSTPAVTQSQFVPQQPLQPAQQPVQIQQVPQTQSIQQMPLLQQPLYPQQVYQQQYPQQQYPQVNQQQYPQVNQQQYPQVNQYGQYQQPYNYTQTQPQTGFNFQQQQQPSYGQYPQQTPAYNNPVYTQPQQNKTANFGGITLSTGPAKKQQDDFGGYESAQSQNVKWLSTEQKGLIDLSDFGSQLKDVGKKNTGQQQINNNIKIDMWNW